MKMIKWIALLVALITVIFCATLIYNNYMESNDGGLVTVNTPQKTEPKGNETEPPKDAEEDQPNDQPNDQPDDQPNDQPDDQPNDQPDDNPNDNETKVEMSAPDFTVIDYEGNEVKLSDFAGKPIVLNFWATWCVYCKMEMPDFDRAFKENPDVLFIMVNATDGYYETVDSAKQYVEGEGYSFTVLFDTKGEAEKAYNVTGWPTTYFINANGDIVAHGSGMLSYETLMTGIGMITE